MAKKNAKEAPAKETKKKAANNADKDAKRKARMEALKNRPAEQRPNSKQIDVIDLGNNSVVKNYGYALKNKEGYKGVLVTSVAMEGNKVVAVGTTFVPGEFTVKSKKNHGTISAPKNKKKGSEVEADEDDEDESED